VVDDDPDTGYSTYPIRTVDRICDILDALADNPDGAQLALVAQAANLPKSSAYRYLAALEAHNYVERNPDTSRYHLGLAFRPQHTKSLDRLADLARPALMALRDRLGETTNLGMLDGTEVVHTVVAESPHMMRLAAREGERGSIHSTALGKAICAALPEARVHKILTTTGMPKVTDATITDPARFISELERVRHDGYAVDDAENQPNGRCVAVRIDGLAFLAGVSVSAPAHRFPIGQIPAVAVQLADIARSLSEQMVHDAG
jgi:IclR family acetate operon transcriptional repressor